MNMENKKLTFDIVINAPVEKVWSTMLDKDTYEQWTTVFSPDSVSSYEGSWEQGASIKFGDGEGNGMLAVIAENRLHEFVSTKHVAMIMNGEETKFETPAFENYTFTATDGGTKLLVELDGMDEYKEMFEEMWPKALQKLKELCEG